MTTASPGDQVAIHYTGTLDDGTVFDSSREREPIAFVAGGDELIQGVSEGVIGMCVGETRTLRVPPEMAYGERDEELMTVVPRNQMPDDVQLGDRLVAETGEEQFAVWVVDLDEENASLDRNHPLAGATLTFEVTLVSIEGAGA